jgi:hypothetical protein
VGEFVAVELVDGLGVVQPRFAAYVRQEPYGDSGSASVTTAVSVSFNGGTFTVHARDGGSVDVSGTPVALTDAGTTEQSLSPHAIMACTGRDTCVVETSSGERIEITIVNADQDLSDGSDDAYIDYTITLPPSGDVTPRGLFGDCDGDVGNDLVTPDRAPVENVLGDFAASWRIQSAYGPFKYRPGETTASYTIEGFGLGTGDDAPTEAELAWAEAACIAEGVVDPVVLLGCVADVVREGDPSFAVSAAQSAANTVATAEYVLVPE